MYQNQAGATYNISFESANTNSNNDLIMSTSAGLSSGPTISYKVNFYASGDGSGDVSVVTKNNVPVTGVKGATQNISSSTPTSSLKVVVDASNGIPAGNYSDTLTITVRPE